MKMFVCAGRQTKMSFEEGKKIGSEACEENKENKRSFALSNK